jgi:hypothetical protein
MGPEALRSIMARLQPADLRMSGTGDEILQRFQLKLLTEGSGTQLFSTSFAQWTAREVLRRPQPLTLLVRFAPRQRQKPMNELLSANSNQQEMDVVGSFDGRGYGRLLQLAQSTAFARGGEGVLSRLV